MALLTTRQKQQLIGPVLIFLLLGGFVGALWQGNPVAIAVLVLLVAAFVLVIWLSVAKKRGGRKAAEARTEQEREQDREAAKAAIEKIKRLRPTLR